ncbi:uncharacterized protein LOC111642322 [Centruroides sculpturatus]|uniref:uncharacterized protein LOC111642322 n=1 Tax=Centruroides sculpturatus TaxID=218467 RepID=UPI000C6D5488|nr:uncharacterized protein LOC111642322 [Centruroides sculpturatus]
MPNEIDLKPEISRAALKLPQSWHKKADLWFINIEAQFKLADISQDTTKYYAVVSAFNSEVLAYVSDIVKNPPRENLYQTLKDRLIAKFSHSEQKRVKDLLSNAVLGDDKPSHLLRKMRQLASNKVGEEFLRTLWIQRLPKETQAILSVSDGDLDKLAQMADKILELTPLQIAKTNLERNENNTHAAIMKLQTQVAELTEQVNRLARPSDRQSRDYRHPWNRQRSQTPVRPQAKDLCWYHAKFGDEANKCKAPCKFRAGKLARKSHVAQSDFQINNTSRLFVYDPTSRRHYLIDSGSDICVLPYNAAMALRAPASLTLYSANNSPIKTYGTKLITVSLNLRRQFTWPFVIANVSKPIIGADFIRHFGLLIDLKNARITDPLTSLTTT